MHPHISAIIADAHVADLRAAADRRRPAAPHRSAHFARLRAGWRTRRGAPAAVGRPREA